MTNQTVIVTGGAGYIGSHVCKALSEAGYQPVCYDNLATGHRYAVRWGPVEIGDVRDRRRLAEVFDRYRPAAVLHFAAFAYVGESVVDPEKYYDNNVMGSLHLLAAMHACGIPRIVFSSTCATYGNTSSRPIDEDTPQYPVNPYGTGKLLVERAILDYCAAYGMKAMVLRYFNACGADSAGEIGEHHDPETHLIPCAIKTARGEVDVLKVFGTNYRTEDGTCIRDYIHVTDLADGHVRALEHLLDGGPTCALNLGTGLGVSVRQIIRGVERVSGRSIRVEEVAPRPGDPAVLVADPRRAREVLGFRARYTDIGESIASAWRWHDREVGAKYHAPDAIEESHDA